MKSQRHHHRQSGNGTGMYILIVGSILLVCVIIVGVLLLRKKDVKTTPTSSVEAPDYDNADKWSEGVISYNGQKYRYNKNIRTYLFLGIDSDEPVHKAENGISGGQSDALFLLVENREKDKMSIISIHRNTMTEVQVYDENGEYIGHKKLQVCLQHGYGDGERLSCQRTADCVSNLFFGIPIHGYMALNMGGIGLLNNAVDGVEVTVLHNIDHDERNVHLVEGETKVLNGDEAYVYVRSRDVSEFDSATDRLKRQEQYLNGLLPQMQKKMKSVSSAAEIYSKAEDYLYSNIDYSRLANELTDMTYDSTEDMYNIPGEVVMGEEFEEFHVDDDGLYQLILEIFYDKVD